MKSTRKTIVRVGALTLALTLVFALPIASAAILIPKTIDVRTGVTIVADGIEYIPTNVNGERVDTFLYNGTTYVPIRAMSELFGKGVTWDGTTGTVYIGDNPNTHQWLLDVCKPYRTDVFREYKTVTMAGKKFAHGFILGEYALGGGGYNPGYADFNLDCRYNTLEFDIGCQSGSAEDAELYIYLDDQLAYTIDLNCDMLPEHHVVPLNF